MSERTGVSAHEAKYAAWAVTNVSGAANAGKVAERGDASGIKVGGARAAALALAVGRDARWPLIAWQTPLKLLGLPWVLDRVYELVAANRYRIPGDEPWCSQHAGQCEPPPSSG